MTTDTLGSFYRRKLVDDIRVRVPELSSRVSEAFLAIPRSAFVDGIYQPDTRTGRWSRIWRIDETSELEALSKVYEDVAIVTAAEPGTGAPSSSSSAPWLMAKMLDLLDLTDGHRVLEIGTGTGFNAALISHLVGSPDLVTTIDINEGVASSARERLQRTLGKSPEVLVGDGSTYAFPPDSFDRVIVTAGNHYVCLNWLDALVPGGQLLMNFKCGLTGALLLLTKNSDGLGAAGSFVSDGGIAFMHLLTEDGRFRSDLGLDTAELLAGEPLTHDAERGQELQMSLESNAFQFFVQLHIPDARLFYFGEGPEWSDADLYLTIPPKQQTVRFSKKRSTRVEIWGGTALLDSLVRIMGRWTTLDRPTPSHFRYSVTVVGQQFVFIPGHDARWRLWDSG